METERGDIDGLGVLFAMVTIVMIVVCVGYIVFVLYADFTVSYGTITVTEKVGAHGSHGQYLIIASDDQVYTVEDNFVYMKFDASDRYAALKEGKTYSVTFTGFRNHVFSMYKNILEFKEVSGDGMVRNTTGLDQNQDPV